jgi:hypothetical protein
MSKWFLYMERWCGVFFKEIAVNGASKQWFQWCDDDSDGAVQCGGFNDVNCAMRVTVVTVTVWYSAVGSMM